MSKKITAIENISLNSDFSDYEDLKRYGHFELYQTYLLVIRKLLIRGYSLSNCNMVINRTIKEIYLINVRLVDDFYDFNR